jgi:peroxiredoxin
MFRLWAYCDDYHGPGPPVLSPFTLRRPADTGARRQDPKGITPNTRNETMKIRKFLTALALSAMAAGSLASSGLTGQPAPDFALKSSTGENLRLSEYRGDVVMINFWATWCGPCRQEMPLLDDLYNRYERVGFNLLGVNIDDDSGRAMDMIRELGVNFPVLFDARKEVSKLYEVGSMPVTVIVDREGTVRYVHQGYKPGYEQMYLDQVRSLLRE